MSESEKSFPLKVIHYKTADYGGESYDVGVRITEADIQEADEYAQGKDIIVSSRINLAAARLMEKFRAPIEATLLKNDPTLRQYNPEKWLIEEGELAVAVRRIVAENMKKEQSQSGQE